MSGQGISAVVTGGGTAGHVLPALAVAEALVAAGSDPDEIHYIGSRRGIETRLVPETPFPHTFLDVIGFQRRLTRRNLGFVPKMLRSTLTARRVLRDLRPEVVVSVGGYASMPAVFAARRLHIPVVVVSYDRFPGRASQLAARRAAACAVAFDDSPLPRATVTGAPLRRSVLDVDRETQRAAAREALGVPDDRFLVAVMGGSQGSGVLNGAVVEFLAEHRGDHGLAVRHVVGERFIDEAPAPLDGSDGIRYDPIGYEDRMPTVYAAADLLVGRGGASTVHEVAATGIPAVLVPWSDAAEDHQAANVRWLSDQGAAVFLAEDQLDRLTEVIAGLRSDPAARADLSSAARGLGEVHRSGALADLVRSAALA
ncbi:MAG: UDP-N-acetylglucosamine--N-acetylmuramyl-(pentapeptide) pyrophosphoryl-undecaprenol N-acetylglucosamine transferase [Ilumatobacter sp.]|nr:MAG: UDP-N-acetylglucosamine--N-acetylmuramyl-(pentapeptide) pyrophosphoryl-undecaprenol N-acetylglucosamine transferase [Ilumatobacter sp.]